MSERQGEPPIDDGEPKPDISPRLMDLLHRLADDDPDLATQVVQRFARPEYLVQSNHGPGSEARLKREDIEELSKHVEISKQAVLVRQLVNRRRELSLTQSDVARTLGTSQSAIARLEALVQEPKVTLLAKYAALVGLELRLVQPTELGTESNDES